MHRSLTAPEPEGPSWTAAEIHARGRTTPYRHTGRGAAVLALSRVPSPGFLAACARLARDARVIVPAWPSALGDDALLDWLLDLLDALGLESAGLATDRSAATLASRAAQLAPDRVRDVRMVTAGAPRDASSPG